MKDTEELVEPHIVTISDPNTAAQLLKAFFRELPEPLFTFL
jgi:hypothetical protein